MVAEAQGLCNNGAQKKRILAISTELWRVWLVFFSQGLGQNNFGLSSPEGRGNNGKVVLGPVLTNGSTWDLDVDLAIRIGRDFYA